jgi:hypothetical protein
LVGVLLFVLCGSKKSMLQIAVGIKQAGWAQAEQ